MTRSGDPPLVVDIRRLTVDGQTLGSGGQSSSLKLCTLDGRSYVLKRYSSEVAGQLRVEALRRTVEWGRRIGPTNSSFAARLAWPLSIVSDETRRSCGILMKPAPRRMYERLAQGTQKSPRHLDVLAMHQEKALHPARQPGTQYCEPPLKLAVLANFLDTMLSLHRHGYSAGDLHLRNALFDPDRRDVLLLDCDACVSRDHGSALPFGEPEIWRASAAGGKEFNMESDFQKFGWIVVRCLQDSTEAPVLDGALLRTMMSTKTFDLLERTCEGTSPAAYLTEHWRPYVTLWPSLVTDRQMYVQTDDFIRTTWRSAKKSYAARSAPEPAWVGTSAADSGPSPWTEFFPPPSVKAVAPRLTEPTKPVPPSRPTTKKSESKAADWVFGLVFCLVVLVCVIFYFVTR